jgi:ADP-ribosylglycohydrolase
MLVGLAIGDSLGNTSESRTPAERAEEFGEIRDYQPHHRADGRAVGLPSDDTQLAFWTLEQLLKDDGLIPENLARRFSSGRIFGIGSTVRAFLKRRAEGAPWLKACQESAGNGALMRIAPVLLPHLRAPSTALWADALLAGAVTHNDFGSNACCVAFTRLLWDALRAKSPVPAGFWISRFEQSARAIEGDELRYKPRTPGLAGSQVSLWRFTTEKVGAALDAGRPVVEACNSWYSGAFLLETMPSVLYILERHGNDPEQAIIRAVNDTRDNDTVAAVVGAAIGALHGLEALPPRWRKGLLGRTAESDDGRVFELIDAAKARWASKG